MSDLINRADAIEAVDALWRVTGNAVVAKVWQQLKDLPSAEPERHGRWIESDNQNEKYVCSVCGGSCWYYDWQGEVAKSKFCPNCGARMDGESD